MPLKLVLLILIISIFKPSFGQDDSDQKEFFVGVNLGGYFANKNTAYFYNGNTSYGIQTRILKTRVYEEQISEEFNNYNYDFGEYPELMRYKPSFQIGVHLGYNVSDNFALIGEFDVINLKVQDVVTFNVEDPSVGSLEPTIEQIPIFGEEKRFAMNLGFQNTLYTQEAISIYWGLAGNFTFTQYENNTMVIGSRTFDLGNPFWNTNGGTKPKGGGSGAMASFGFKYRLNDQVVFDIGYKMYYTSINLSHPSQAEPFKFSGLQHNPYIRIIWG